MLQAEASGATNILFKIQQKHSLQQQTEKIYNKTDPLVGIRFWNCSIKGEHPRKSFLCSRTAFFTRRNLNNARKCGNCIRCPTTISLLLFCVSSILSGERAIRQMDVPNGCCRKLNLKRLFSVLEGFRRLRRIALLN